MTALLLQGGSVVNSDIETRDDVLVRDGVVLGQDKELAARIVATARAMREWATANPIGPPGT